MRWTLKPKPEPAKVEELQKNIQVDAITASLLMQRCIET